MLRKLSISNYTVMSRVDVDFQPGLNVITGETGVGKSLLLDAVGSLLGERRSGFPIRSGCSQAVIEAEFDSDQVGAIHQWLESRDFAADLPVILRREFHKSGRTRIFINDSPASLALSKELGDLLLDLHGQHEVVTLFNRTRQLELLDAFARNPAILSQYKSLYGGLQAAREELSRRNAEIEDANAGGEALRKQKDELDALKPQPDEIATVEGELQRLENSEKIYELCAQICDHLNEAPQSAVEHLNEIAELLPELYPFHDPLRSWEDELKNVRSILIELNRTLQELNREVRHDPGRVENLRQRIAALTGFQKRWRCEGRDLCEVAEDVDWQLVEMEKKRAEAGELEEKIKADTEKLIDQGRKLSDHRKAAAKKLMERVHQKLASIGMEKARFDVLFESTRGGVPGDNGLDRIEFVLSPDGKLPYQPLRQVASGGEMSRILLALKGSLAEADQVETLIFDEIDQGISGRIARMVGLQLLELSRRHQVIVVTHLPQIASLGDLHLSVRPTGDAGSAVVQALSEEERLQELATLLTATGMSDGALLNAREMLESARNLKNVS